MIGTPEDRRAAENDAKDQEEQPELFDTDDQADKQEGTATPADTEELADSPDAEFAADEKIRQREELLEEKAV